MSNQHYNLKFDPQKIQQETTQRLTRYVIYSLIVTIIIFLAGILIFPLSTALPDAPHKVDWTILEGIMSLLTVSLVIGGGVFVFFEYINNEIQQMRDSAQASFNIYTQLYDRVTSPIDTAARRWILQNLSVQTENQTKEAWLQQVQTKLLENSEESPTDVPLGQTHLRRVLNTFDYIGFVSENYWNMENELVDWMSPLVAKVRDIIGPYVEYEAVLRNEPDFFQSARSFGNHCLQWRNKHYPKWNIIEDAT